MPLVGGSSPAAAARFVYSSKVNRQGKRRIQAPEAHQLVCHMEDNTA